MAQVVEIFAPGKPRPINLMCVINAGFILVISAANERRRYIVDLATYKEPGHQ